MVASLANQQSDTVVYETIERHNGLLGSAKDRKGNCLAEPGEQNPITIHHSSPSSRIWYQYRQISKLKSCSVTIQPRVQDRILTQELHSRGKGALLLYSDHLNTSIDRALRSCLRSLDTETLSEATPHTCTLHRESLRPQKS